MNKKSNRKDIETMAFAAMDAAAEQETKADLIVKTEDLREAVRRMRCIVPKKSTHPILSCILIKANIDGRFLAKVTDLEMTVKYIGRTVTGKSARDCKIAIPFCRLAALLPCIRTEHVSFYDNGQSVTIQAGGFRAVIQTYPAADFPQDTGYEKAVKFAIHGSLIEELLNASKCASSDDSRKVLHGVNVEIRKNGDCVFVATDGKQLFSARFRG